MYWIGYGNHPDPNDKQWAYWGKGDFKTGQSVRVPAFNKRAGRVIQTMGQIFHSSEMYSKNSEMQAAQLGKAGIHIRDIIDTRTLELPGAWRENTALGDYERTFDSKAAWSRESAARQNLTNDYGKLDPLSLRERMLKQNQEEAA